MPMPACATAQLTQGLRAWHVFQCPEAGLAGLCMMLPLYGGKWAYSAAMWMQAYSAMQLGPCNTLISCMWVLKVDTCFMHAAL